MKMKLTGKQRKELEWRIAECLQDEMVDIHGDELGWWAMPEECKRVVNKVIEAIELD